VTTDPNKEPDTAEKLSALLHEMETKSIDVTINQLQLMQNQKMWSAKSGELLGQINQDGQTSRSTSGAGSLRVSHRQETLICKSDCIILEIEQDIFDILIKQKLRKDREKVADQILVSFPKISKYYTLLRITENAY